MEEKYIFVIDTDTYAGNFERPLCAYMTGQVGDCGVGGYEAAEFEADETISEDLKCLMQDIVGQEPDEHGCHRPATIIATPDYYNSGGNEHHISEPEDKVLAKMRKTRVKYLKERIPQYQSQLDAMLAHDESGYGRGWSVKTLQQEISNIKQAIEEAEQATEIPRYPAYLSVGIHFLQIPDAQTIDFLKARAYTYASREPKHSWDKTFKISGFRLLTRRTVDESQAI